MGKLTHPSRSVANLVRDPAGKAPTLLPALALASLLFAPLLPAQSAANFDTAAAAPVPAATAAPSAAPDFDITTPSRMVGDKLEAYIAKVSAGFAMRTRATDPFGKYQDPDAKPAVAPTASPTLARRSAPEPAVPLSQIVRMIKVTTVVPGEKLFLVGTRSIRQGGRIPLTFSGKSIVVEVVEVNSRQIVFRNVETGETGLLKLDLLPEGMSPGNSEITPPGMQPVNPNAPLVLGAN